MIVKYLDVRVLIVEKNIMFYFDIPNWFQIRRSANFAHE